jgi:hypothetical protein
LVFNEHWHFKMKIAEIVITTLAPISLQAAKVEAKASTR